jgi:hypothetical protein
MRIGVSEK